MPSLYGYDVEDMVVNRPRRVLNDEEHIALDNTAAIVPFAQQEIVHAFLRGVDENLKEYMQESTGELFTGVISSILDAVERVDTTLRKPLEEAIGPEVNRVLGRLFNRWEKETVNYWGPVIEIVGSLPKDELADMAEALINLTKFRRRITPERETVGGPIDVAVITKGDGFVWIKRKHYFDSELNPRVIARYLGEGRNG